jgi:hypothetical protein
MKAHRSRAWANNKLVDARHAAHCLSLPKYWLTDPKERRNRKLPYCRIGSLIRFDVQKLLAWMHAYDEASRATRRHDSDQGLPANVFRAASRDTLCLQRVDDALAVPRRCYRGAGSNKSSY